MRKWLGLAVTVGVFGTFNNQLTLAEFGQAANPNTALQTSSRYTASEPLRTNDYQPMQLNVGTYSTGRFPTRFSQYLVDNSAVGGQTIPAGARVVLSSLVQAGDQAENVEPNRFVRMVQDPNYMVFGFTETTGGNMTIDVDFPTATSSDFQVLDIEYTGSSGGNMVQHLVQGSPYHDVEYTSLTPLITMGNGIISELTVDDEPYVLPTSGSSVTLPEGTKFRFKLENKSGQPAHTQYWILYAQSDSQGSYISGTSGEGVPITFTMTYSLTADDRVIDATLTASRFYDGFVRLAAFETTEPTFSNTTRRRTAPKWQIDTMIQCRPTTPLTQFFLWPVDWTQNVGPQLLQNERAQLFISSCATNTYLSPLLARFDAVEANCWFYQLIDKNNAGPTIFDAANNPLLLNVNQLIALNYGSEIQTFQNSAYKTPTAAQDENIANNPALMEFIFDTYRSGVVLDANLSYLNSGNLRVLYKKSTQPTTFPASAGGDTPLICFPAYKTVTGSTPLVGVVNRDPIMGYISHAAAQSLGSFNWGMTYVHSYTVPIWADRLIPDDLWINLSTGDRASLELQVQKVVSNGIPSASSDVLEQGRLLTQMAMTARTLLYVKMAMLGHTPPYTIAIPSSVKAVVQPYINYIEDILDGWLISQTYNGSALSNYFIGDSTTGGIVAVKGTASASSGTLDDGNAVYDGHNYQYGHYLFAAGVAAELDRLFGNTAWIAKSQTKGATTAKTKAFIDVLWRDSRNISTGDSSFPYNRYQNIWMGISNSLGVPAGSSITGRVARMLESIAEDFHAYYGLWLYARAIRDSTALTTADQEDFDLLENFAKTNMHMLVTAGRGIFYNTGSWALVRSPFNFNKTTGRFFDNEITTEVPEAIGTPECRFTREGCTYSEYRRDVFYKAMTNDLQ